MKNDSNKGTNGLLDEDLKLLEFDGNIFFIRLSEFLFIDFDALECFFFFVFLKFYLASLIARVNFDDLHAY